MNEDSEAELRSRIGQLEARIARLESQQSFAKRPTPVLPLPVSPLLVEPAVEKSITAETPLSTLAAAARDFREAEKREPEFLPGTSIPLPPVDAASAVPRPIQPPPLTIAAPTVSYQSPRRTDVPQGNFERAIGLKLAGWLGAVVLLIGIGFGVKFIYDQHWFGVVPPIVWLGAIFAGGFCLIGLGEWVFRRVNQLSAVGLYGAGVATLFLAGFLGSSYYQLYSSSTALLLMAAASLIGGAVALRGNLVSIAVLALLGGNIAPLVIATPNSPLPPFLLYLLALQLMALGLASIGRGRKWWTLRGLSLATTAFWVAGAIDRPQMGWTVMLFAAVYTAIYHLEPILTAARRRVDAFTADPVVFAVVTTSAFTALLLDYTQNDPAAARGRDVLGLGIIVAILGLALTGMSSSKGRFSRWKPLGMTHRWCAIGLFTLAVPIGLRGAPVEATWAVMAVVLSIVSSRTTSRIAPISAAIVWALAIAHLMFESQEPSQRVFAINGVEISRQLLSALMLALVGQWIAGTGFSVKNGSRRISIWVSIVASILWCAACIGELPPMWGTGMILIFTWLLLLAANFSPTLPLAEQSLLLLAIATAKWAAETAHERVADDWSASRRQILFNGQFAIGTALAGSIVVSTIAGRLTERLRWLTQRRYRSILWSIAAIVLVVAVSLEIDRFLSLFDDRGQLGWSLDRARQNALTVWWITAASSALFALRLLDREASTQRQWPTVMPILIRLVAAKYLIVDLVYFRATEGGASGALPVFNVATAVAAVVLAALSLNALSWPGAVETSQHRLVSIDYLLVAAIVWIAGSMEIARLNGVAFNAGSAWLSVYWSIVAIAAVISGFALRNTALRFFGLGLFAITCLKVVIVDMSGLATGYRVLSFMGLGVLLIGTSVLYGRFGAGLLESAPPRAID